MESYLLYLLNSTYAQSVFLDKVHQVAQPKLSIERAEKTHICFPSIHQQQRIVEKIEELFAQVDKIQEVETTEKTLPESKNQDAEIMQVNTKIESITKEDYVKILELLKTPNFVKMTSLYSAKEAMIVSLKLGYIDGKCFSNSAALEQDSPKSLIFSINAISSGCN